MSNTRPKELPKNSRDQIVALKKAMRNQGIYTFGMNSSYKPKWSAQSALRGKCHYVDDDTLSFFNAKVNDAGPFALRVSSTSYARVKTPVSTETAESMTSCTSMYSAQ